MKKILLLLILLIPINVNAISASSYIVMDMASNRVLISKNMNKESLIASTTKIMTAYIAIIYGNLNDKVRIGEEILKSTGSAIYLNVGDVISLESLVYGLMLRSGNDAALAIATHISGSVEGFTALMNSKAKEIGMKNTYFYNPHGLEESNGKGNTSTVYDMALLTSVAMKNKKYQTITSTKHYKTKSVNKSFDWYNKNKLLFTYEYTTGGKTGYTKKAYRTLVTTASKDNVNLVVVTFKDGNDFTDHKNLYEEYFKKYNSYLIKDKNKYKSKDKYYKNGKLIINDSIYVSLKEEELSKIKIVEEVIKYQSVNNKDKVGYLKVYLDDKLLCKEEIIYIEKDTPNIFERIFRKIKLWLA